MIHYKIEMPNDLGRKYEVFSYPGGEKQVRLLPGEGELIAKADVIDVTAQIKDGEIMTLALLTTALAGFAKRSIVSGEFLAQKNLFLPYLPYGRADRRFQEGDCFGLGAFAVMVNALGYDRVLTMDPHSEKSSELIDGLEARPITPLVAKAIEIIGKRGLTIILPDKGAERYLPMLKELKIQRITSGSKKRDPKTGQLSGFEFPPVKIKKGLIIDDICDGGGTFIGLAEEIKKQNPKAKLYLYTTHGIYSKGTDQLYKHFERMFCTGSFGNKEAIRWID